MLALHEALEGSAWQRTALAYCGRKEEEVLTNDPKQVHGRAEHTEAVVTGNFKYKTHVMLWFLWYFSGIWHNSDCPSGFTW